MRRPKPLGLGLSWARNIDAETILPPSSIGVEVGLDPQETAGYITGASFDINGADLMM